LSPIWLTLLGNGTNFTIVDVPRLRTLADLRGGDSMKTRLVRGLAVLGIAAGLGLGLGATAGASGHHDQLTNNYPHGHPECASDVWNRDC
jgi:hypothetical protein